MISQKLAQCVLCVIFHELVRLHLFRHENLSHLIVVFLEELLVHIHENNLTDSRSCLLALDIPWSFTQMHSLGAHSDGTG